MTKYDDLLVAVKRCVDYEIRVADTEMMEIVRKDNHWFYSCFGLFRWGMGQRHRDLTDRSLYLSVVQNELGYLIKEENNG